MAHEKVLVVDDRAEARALVACELEEAGFRVVEAGDGLEGFACFREERPHLVVSDLRMPRADGIELLHRIRTVSAVPVILLTGHGDIPTAVAAIKGGAQEFLNFPDDVDHLIQRARELARSVPTSAGPPAPLEALVGQSGAMQRVRDRVAALAPLRVPVLVEGERGTGRDAIVQALHALAGGMDESLHHVSCERSAPGEPPVAGAVYLDEVGRLDPAGQLHWLETVRGAGVPAGSQRLRVYASSSEDLAERARDGSFHPALALRLRRFAIELPPLRQRLEDVPLLAAALLPRIGSPLGRPGVALSAEALARLRQHTWPGNVRELAETLERLIAFTPDGAIRGEHVEEVLASSGESVASLRETRQREQREQLVQLLRACGGNLAEVARQIGMSRGAVIYRARKFGLLPRSRTG